ncbi:transcription antitermination factor NusB [uncultured Shimia sp.]|uniref:RsmB/NOP family class I SAM-dependent RNA methyltransferase n=1 Tax=uncultured Shimia sp. TaxID=573152 RepID=UPI00263730BF|nr:transcription antitermination factor NusB [uncultured Shimia sp.]
MSQSGIQARRSAVYLLDQVLGEGRLLSELIGSGALEKLQPEDRARAQRLATDTLRGLERADRILQKHLQKYPPLTVRNTLRLATIELCSGGAAHGVVNAAVEIVGRNKRTAAMKGLVNAVLRKVVVTGPETWPILRTPRLPKWLRGPLVAAYGPETVAAMEVAHFAGAPLDLTAKGDKGALHRSLGGTFLPTGSVRLDNPGQVSELPGFKKGSWWVQDAAAAIPVQILNPQPDEKVLDLCAAPGGKTMQIAASGAEVTAVDDSASRMTRVQQNLKRTKLKAECIVGDVMAQSGQWDAILLDAPCSATGTIRRHPDLPHAKDGSEFGGLIELQAVMLDHALSLLKPGGRLVFCTCSLLPDEGECQVEDALARHKGLTVDREALAIEGIDPEWITEEGGLRLRPDFWSDKGGMDGFYVACLRKA